MYIYMQFEVLYTISYQVIQKHIARYKFLTIFKERKIKRKKNRNKKKINNNNKNKNRFEAKRGKIIKQNYTAFLFQDYLYIICTY